MHLPGVMVSLRFTSQSRSVVVHNCIWMNSTIPKRYEKGAIRVNNLYSLVYPGPRGFPWFFSAWERCEAVKMNCDSCSLLCEKKPQKSRQKPLEPGCDFCQSVLLLEAMRIRTCMNWPESQESSWGETVDEEYWRHRMKELFSTFISLVKQA